MRGNMVATHWKAHRGKIMKNVLKNTIKKEDGMLIVEASYVFPIMVLVILMLIYAGNAYLQKCRIEAITTQYVVNGAAYCGDPVTEYLQTNNDLPRYETLDVKPYRFLLGGMSDVTSQIEDQIETEIDNMGGGLFASMQPDLDRVNVDFNNAFIYSTLSADVEYEITLPIRMLGENEPVIMEFDVRIDVPVSDSVELIRNVDMIEDYLQRSEDYLEFQGVIDNVTQNIKELVGIRGGE